MRWSIKRKNLRIRSPPPQMKLCLERRMHLTSSSSTPQVQVLLLLIMLPPLLWVAIKFRRWLVKQWTHLLNDKGRRMSNLGCPCKMPLPHNSPTLVLHCFKTYNKPKCQCWVMLLLLHLLLLHMHLLLSNNHHLLSEHHTYHHLQHYRYHHLKFKGDNDVLSSLFNFYFKRLLYIYI